jgi:flagellar hook-associated protein 3
MAKRITFGQMSDGVQQYIFSNQAKVDKLQRQLASGRKLVRPSDDPVGVSNALDLRTALSANAQYQRNVDGGAAYLATMDTTINGNNEFLQRARELGIQGANDTLTAENRGYIAREVRGIFDQMVALSNTTFRGEYVFSGTNTQLPPYEVRNGASRLTAAEVNGGTLGTPIQLVDANVTDSLLTPTGVAPAYHIIPGTFSINGLTENTDYTVDYVNGTVTFQPPGAAALALAGGGITALGCATPTDG